MELVDFFKKIIRKNIVKERKRKTEKVNFNELGNLVENKIKEIEDREKEIFVLIKDKQSIVIKELNEKIRVLESIDVESKKAEDHIKVMVRGNLNNYIVYVKGFIDNLDNLKEDNLEKFIDRVNMIFLDFDKKSNMSYQKATFLIGKEMAVVKETIINFSKYLRKLLDGNKVIIDSSKTIFSIKSKLKNIDETNEIIDKIDESITVLGGRIKNIKESDKKILKDIEKIKKSKSYIENLKKQEEIKLDEKELEKEVYKLKEIIDFKALAGIFHTDGKKMVVVKEYKKNFQVTFQEDNGARILSLINEAELNNKSILTKIKEINDRKEKIIKNTEKIKKNETEELLFKTEDIKLEIEKLNNEKTKELKKYEKLKTSRKEIINLMKQEFSKINVEVFDS